MGDTKKTYTNAGFILRIVIHSFRSQMSSNKEEPQPWNTIQQIVQLPMKWLFEGNEDKCGSSRLALKDSDQLVKMYKEHIAKD